ncbi:MAG: ParA family protein, partial [Gammaproteobacteria bacterium]
QRLPELGLDLLPANADLTGAEVGLLEELGRELRLKLALEPVKARYSHILIDCPPSLNMLTVNALVAAEALIVPTQCEYYALEGISALVETVEKIRKILNPALRIEGFLRTMYDPRNNLANQVSQQLVKHFGDKVYRTVIPRNVRLAEAPSHGLPALLYDKASAGALAYLALAGEMLRKDDAERLAAGS